MNIFGIGDTKKKVDAALDTIINKCNSVTDEFKSQAETANATMDDVRSTINEMKKIEQDAVNDIKKKTKTLIYLEVVKTVGVVISTALIGFVAVKVNK